LRPLPAIFIVCTIDVLGFGVLVPLVAFMADRYGASWWVLSAILASYSLCQLVTAPIWGRLSDRFGRRPILICSLAGACLSYVALGFAPSLLWLLLARCFNGAMAGNLSAAMAYASDVSAPRDRARAMGVVGVAIALGFSLGPALGGMLAGDSVQGANFVRPALVSAGLSIVAMLLVVLVLRESLDAPQRLANRAAEHQGTVLRVLRERPALRWLVLAGLLVTFSQAALEAVLPLWALARFGLGPRSVGYMWFALALVAVTMQGGLVRRLAPRWGEQRLALVSIGCYVVGLVWVGVAPTFVSACIGLALCGVGSGLFSPTGSALASHQASANNRGVVMGTWQSGTSLARVLGPVVSVLVFTQFGPGAPFLVGALVTAQAAWCMLAAARMPPEAGVAVQQGAGA
jgi:DHA1 family tetracycline resistance protein-like MFS transporter